MGFLDRLLGAPSQTQSPDDGSEHLLERIDQLQQDLSRFQEAAADDYNARRIMERRLEDMAYELLSYKANELDERPEDRKRISRRAFAYWQKDPIVGQAVNLMNWYTFGRGVQTPTVKRPYKDVKAENASLVMPPGTQDVPPGTLFVPDEADVEEADVRLRELRAEDDDQIDDEVFDKAEKALKAFWKQPENQQTLTSHLAQEQKSTELQLDGEIFLLLYDNDDPAEGEANLLLSDLDPSEITEIITSRDNDKMPLWYVRCYQEQHWDYQTEQWVTSTDRIVRYYPHWRNEPGPNDPPPPQEKIGDAKVMHLKINATSRQQRGVSELRRVLEWAKGLHEFMEARLAIARAMNKIAQRVRVEGGPTEVDRVVQAFASGDMLALTRTPTRDPLVTQPQAATLVHTPSMDIAPMSFETGAGTAQIDKQNFLGMIAAGVNWPMPYLGGDNSASLSNSVAMELPTRKQVEARQELWEQCFYDLCRYVLDRAGIPDEVEIEVIMPPILDRDLAAITGAVTALMSALSSTQNVELARWGMNEVLLALGRTDAQEIVKRVFPEGYVMPAAQQAAAAAAANAPPEPTNQEVENVTKQLEDLMSATEYPRARTANGARQRAADPNRGVPDNRGIPR
jgi:hypothetical protein